jgi:AraC family transcriptional regulator
MKLDTRSFYRTAVERIIQHIAGNLDQALDLETLASVACLSPFHFHRVFRGMTGETPLELNRRLRMERAACQVAETSRAVTEIAFDAGYETHEAFTRAFRSFYGTSPSGFKRRKHRRIELAAGNGVHFNAKGPTSQFTPRDTGGHTMDVAIKYMPELRVGTIRHIGPYNQIPLAFEQLGVIVGRDGLFRHAGAAMLAIYYDDPEATPQDQLRSDAAYVVPEGVPMPRELMEQRLPAGRYATTVHAGSYERLGDTWMRLMGEWLPASGHRIGTTPSYEIYVNNPTQVSKEQLKTELYVPVV